MKNWLMKKGYLILMQDSAIVFINKLLDTINNDYLMSESEFNQLSKDFTEFSYEEYLKGIEK